MKRSFTFSMARKVSTGAYENADVLVAETVEADGGMMEVGFEKEKTALIARVRRTVDDLADSMRGV